MEYFDSGKEEFIYLPETDVELEHSLLSISNWESIWHKPFLENYEKSSEEIASYIECMFITPKYPDKLLVDYVIAKYSDDILNYIQEDRTATTFKNNAGGRSSNSYISSELIYYMMSQLGISFETEKWHLSRLMALLKIANDKSSPNKKMSKRDIMSDYARLNRMRREKYNTKG